MKKFGVQLYTVRDYLGTEKEIIESFKKIKDIGYDNVQACLPLAAVSYKRLGEIANETGLEICGTFDSIDMMLDEPEMVAENTGWLNTKFVGTGWMPLPENPHDIVNKINSAADNMHSFGYKFCYHNHNHEFVKINGKRVIDEYIENTLSDKVSFCLDTYWVQAGGGDVRRYIEMLSGRIDILHLKDFRQKSEPPYFAAIGDGNLWWDGIMEAAENAGVKYYVVEQDDCWEENPFAALERSRNFLEKYNR